MTDSTSRVRGQPAGSTTRVALRIGAGPAPAYLADAVERLMRVEGVEVVLALVAPEPSPNPRQTVHAALERGYERLERLLLRSGTPAMRAAPPIRLAETVPRLHGGTKADQLAALAEARPDVLFDVAPDGDEGQLPIPRLGTWRLRYGLGVGGARRDRLTRPSTSHQLAEAVLAIDLGSRTTEACRAVGALHRIGFYRSRDALYWLSAAFAARRLKRVIAGEALMEPASHASSADMDPARETRAASRSSGETPPFRELLAFVFRRVLERVLFTSSWLVLVRRRNPDDGPPTDLRGFSAVAAPPSRFYADPFVIAEGPAARLFVEDCPRGRHRGRIATLTPTSSGWASGGVVLADLDHRAYPHVVRTSQGLLMTPDNGRAGGVDIFRHAEGEKGWVQVGRCLNGVAASDPTLLEWEGRFWLFVAVTGLGMSPWDELHLFSAGDLAGPWKEHPRNPIVADVRRARPAGRIFQSGETLIRPGQDCSTAYGRRIVLNAIITLTDADYEERPISSIEPTGFPGIVRTHTYSFDGTLEALDGYQRRLRFVPMRPS